MTNTMYDVSLAFAKTLNDSIAFKQFCVDTIGDEFTHYVHIDMANVDELEMPYFSFVTYTDTNRSGEYGEVLVQILSGMNRSSNTEDVSGIHTENTQQLLEKVTRYAIELIIKEMMTFGINGEKGFIKEYLNMYASPPNGEEDIQLQIDMILNTNKCL